MPFYTVVDDPDNPRPMQHPAITLVDHDGGPYNPATSIPSGTYAERVTTLTGVAVQDALNAAQTAGGGHVELKPNAIYDTLLPIYVWANTTLHLNGATIRALPGANLALDHSSNALVVMRGVTDVGVEDGIVDVNGHTNALGIVHSCDASATLVATRHTVGGVRVINATNSALRTYSPYVDLTWDDNLIEDCTKGINALAASVLSKGLRITRNRFRRTAGVNIQVYSATASKHADVLVEDNDLRDFTTPASAIPIEVTGSDKATVRDNNIATVATRGVSTGNCNDLAITDNTIIAQTMYAVEIGGSNIVKVTDNLTKGCASLVQETLNPCADVLVADNIYVGSGLSAVPTLSAPAAVIFPNTASKRIRVTGNIFTDWQHLTQGCIRIGSAGVAEDAVVEGNTFVITDAATPLTTVSLRKAVRSSVLRNTIRVQRNLVAADDYIPVISQTIDAASADHLIEHNDVLFTGTVTAAPNAAGIGNGNVAAGPLPGTIVRRNKVTRGPRGIRLMVNSADLAISDNDTSTNANADVPPSAFIPNAAAMGDEYLLSSGGEAVLMRPFGQTVDNAASASGAVVLSYFTAKRTETITQVRMRTGATAAAATPVLCRIGIWSVDADGGLVALLASTLNDPTLFAAANTTYIRALTASWVKAAGTRYAIGYLVVSATATPSFVGGALAVGVAGQAAAAVNPRLNALIPGQVDLPASFAYFSLNNTSRLIQFECMT